VFVLATERLTIRLIDEADAPFILELLNDPSFIRNIGDRNVRTLDDAREYIQKGPLASYERHGFGLWLVELKGEGTPIGICGLLKRDVLDAPDVGFAYLPAFQRRGYGFEAARAVLDHARDTLRLPRVLAIVNADNEASARLLEKLGMRFEGMVQVSDGEPSLRLFALSRPDGDSHMSRCLR
jgi:[ribosomal protein S5]-alanine N-acetyltransferase